MEISENLVEGSGEARSTTRIDCCIFFVDGSYDSWIAIDGDFQPDF